MADIKIYSEEPQIFMKPYYSDHDVYELEFTDHFLPFQLIEYHSKRIETTDNPYTMVCVGVH